MDKFHSTLFNNLILENFRLNGLLIEFGDRLTDSFGLTSAKWQIMGAIESRNSGITVPQIGRYLGLSRQAIQRQINALKSSGYIVIINNPDHKKAKLITLTAEGHQVFSDIMNLWENEMKEINQSITPDRFSDAIALLVNLQKIIKKIKV